MTRVGDCVPGLSQSIVEIGSHLFNSIDLLSHFAGSSMAQDGRYPASLATAPGRGFPTPPQGTTFAATVAASDPISSESSSPSRRASSLTGLIPDMADPHSAHNRRLSASSHGVAVPEGSAALFPRRSSLSSSPRARDLDHHHHHHHHHTYHHHHQGRSRGDGSVPVSRPSTLQRVASEIRRLARTPDVPPSVSEDDWSVFGEAMAHEGVQPQPPSPGVAGPAPHTLVTTPLDETGYASPRWTQSPKSDAHLEDYFPPVEEGEEEDGQDRRDFDGRSSLDTGLRASLSHVDSDTESSPLLSPKGEDRSLRGSGKRWWKRASHLPALPTLYRNIFKCSLAYFLGSLFTYYTPLSRFIAELTQDGPGEKYPSAMGHMVATV